MRRISIVMHSNYLKGGYDSFLRQYRVNPVRWRWKDPVPLEVVKLVPLEVGGVGGAEASSA